MDGILSVFYFWRYMYTSIFLINELPHISGDVGVYTCRLLWAPGRAGLPFCHDWLKVTVSPFIIVLIKVIHSMFRLGGSWLHVYLQYHQI